MNKALKKILLFLSGSSVLICGVALILFWWEDVTGLFRGGAGMALALTGLLILYMIRD